MKWSWAFSGSMSAAALLLSLAAAADSQLQSGAATAAAGATAHLNFRIIIPKMLYLRVRDSSEHGGSDTVSVHSNGHDVALTASVRAHDDEGSGLGHMILSAAARRVIDQDLQCGRGAASIICTVSMP